MQLTQYHLVLGWNGALTAAFALLLSRQALLFAEVASLPGYAGSVLQVSQSQQKTHTRKDLAHLQGCKLAIKREQHNSQELQ